MPLPDDERYSKLEAIRTELDFLKKLIRDADTIKKAMNSGVMGYDEYRAMGAMFEELGTEESLAGIRDPSSLISDPESIAFKAKARSLGAIADTVQGRLMALETGQAASGMANFAKSTFESFVEGLGGIPPAVVETAGFGGQKLMEMAGAPPAVSSSLPLAAFGVPGISPDDAYKFASDWRTGMNEKLGVPADPMLRMAEAQGRGTSGMWGHVAGNMAALLASFIVTGGTGPAAGATGILSKTLPLGRAGLSVFGISAASGLTGFMTGSDDPDTPHMDESDLFHRFNRGMAFGGAAMLIGTAIVGRPVGLPAHTLSKSDLILEAGRRISDTGRLASMRHRIGTSLGFAPKLTVGHMLNSAGIGAAFVTAEMRNQGEPIDKALAHGITEGLAFAGYDTAFSRIGGVNRAMALQMGAAQGSLKYVAALGLAGAGSGALIDMAGGGDPGLATAALGAAGVVVAMMARRGVAPGQMAPEVQALLKAKPEELAQARASILSRLRNTMPEDTVLKLAEGRIGELSTEDLSHLANVITGDSIREVLLYSGDKLMDDAGEAYSQTFKDMVGPEAAVGIQKAAYLRQQRLLIEQMMHLEAEGVPLTDPRWAQFFHNYSQLRENLTRLFKEEGLTNIPHSPVVTIDGKDIPYNVAHARVRNYQARQADGSFFLPRHYPEPIGPGTIKAQAEQAVGAARRIEEAGAAQAIGAARSTARKKARQGRPEERLGVEALPAQFGVARSVVNDLPISDVMTELQTALNLSRNQVRKEAALHASPHDPLGHKWIRDRVAQLRAAQRSPNAPLKRPLGAQKVERPRVEEGGRPKSMPKGAETPGAPKPVRYARDPEKLAEALDTIETLLQSGDADEKTVREYVRTILGGTLGVDRGTKAGPNWKLKIPEVGEFRGVWLRKVLEDVRDRLKDIVPVASVAPGFLLFQDEDGAPGTGWLAGNEGYAALAALGIVMMGRGRATRMRGLTKLMRQAGKRAGERWGRESIIALTRDGRVGAALGSNKNVGDQIFSKLGGSPNISLLFHNHPPATTGGKPLARGGETGVIQASADLMNMLPSGTDMKFMTTANQPGSRAVGLLLTPDGQDFTFFSSRKSGLDAGIEIQKRWNTLRTRFVNDLRKEMGLPMVAQRKGAFVEYAGAADTLVMAQAASRDGLDAFTQRYIREVYEPLGVTVRTKIPDSEVDILIHNALRQTSPNSYEDMAAHIIADGPGYLDDHAAKAFDRDLQKRLRQIITDEAPAVPATKAAPGGATLVKAPLPQTITAQDFTRAGTTLMEARTWARELGMDIQFRSTPVGVRTFTAVDSQGVELASANTLGKLMKELQAKSATENTIRAAAAPSMPLVTKDETVGDAVRHAGTIGGLMGGITGMALGPVIQRYAFDNTESSVAGAFGGAAAGYLVGTLAGFKGGGFIMNRQANKAIKLFVPEVPKPLAPKQAASLVGKEGLDQEVFYRMPLSQQIDHTLSRINALLGKKTQLNKAGKNVPFKLKEKRSAIQATLVKYTPYVLDAESMAKMEEAVFQAGRALDLSPGETTRLWRGYLAQITEHPHTRKFAQNLNIFSLSQPIVSPLGSRAQAEQLKQAILTAKVVSGPIASLPINARGVARMARAASIPSEESEVIRESLRLIQETRLKTAGGTLPISMRAWTAKLLPTESIRSHGMRLVQRGNSDGHTVLGTFNVINEALAKMEGDTRQAYEELSQIVSRMTKQQRTWVRKVMEGDGKKTAAEWRKSFQGKNDVVIEAADKVRALLNKWARANGMEESKWIEYYFPHYYSQRSLREIRKTGLLPDEPITLHSFSGFPRNKFFRSAAARSYEDPLGPIIEDVGEAGRMYLYGAVRKFYIDQMIKHVDYKMLRDLGTREPFVARQIANWILDIHGIPREGEVAAKAWLESMGVAVEDLTAAMGLDSNQFVKAVMNKYFEKADPRQISQAIRGFEFFSKIGFSMITPLVNLTQTVINTGTDVGFHNMFVGAMNVGRGAIAEKAPFVGPWLDPALRGRKILKLARESGVMNQSFINTIDDIARAPSFGTRENVIKSSLQLVKDSSTYLFDMAETVNRAVAAGGAEAQFTRAAKLLKKGKTGRAGDVVEASLVGGASGGLFGAGLPADTQEERFRNAAVGAVAGGTLLGGLQARSTPTAKRVASEVELLKANRPFVKSAAEIGKDIQFTQDDVLKWYLTQVTEMSQFRFSRASRGEILRTPLGESMFALQTYTLNQAEFLGSRMQSFIDTGGKDTRIFRHAILLLGTAGALTSVAGFVDSDRGNGYWLSRVGFGLMPFIAWNSAAEKWQVQDFFDTLGRGPFISDVERTAQTFLRLATDPKARDQWAVQLDSLARDVIVAMRQVEQTPATIGAGLENLGLEGLADMVKSQQGHAAVAGRPLGHMTGQGMRGAPPKKSGQLGSIEGIEGLGGF